MAVNDVSLDVYRGEVFGFIGPNGSGKSTTIGMILGLLKPTFGSVELFGEELHRAAPAILRRVGVVFETQAYESYLSGKDNLELLARIAGNGSAERVGDLLEQVGLGDDADRKVKSYSLGMRQRLSLAAALLNDPVLLVLDEPTNGLDATGILDLRTIMADLAQQGKAVFLASHLLSEVEKVCDRLAIVRNGSILAQGRPFELGDSEQAMFVRVSEPDKGLIAAQGVVGAERVMVADGRLRVNVPQERAEEVVAALVDEGLYPTEITYERNSLEKVFREVVAQ
jgi:ABC-2 type transport system ATP-binding protein